MSLTATLEQSATLDGQKFLDQQQVLTPAEEIKLDKLLTALLVDSAISIGIPDTAKLKGLQLTNIGNGDITSIKIDGGTLAVPLKVGESIVLGGPGVAKGVVDGWSNATTLLLLKVTTPAGPTLAHLRGVFLVEP